MLRKTLYTALMAALLIVAAACGGDDEPDPKDAVDGFLAAFLAVDVDRVALYLTEAAAADLRNELQAQDDEGRDFARTLFAGFTYEIGEATTNGSEAVVTIDMTAPNLAVVLGDLAGRMFTAALSGLSEAEMEAKVVEIMTELLDDPALPTVSGTSTVNLTLVEGAWRLDGTAVEAAFAPLAEEFEGGLIEGGLEGLFTIGR